MKESLVERLQMKRQYRILHLGNMLPLILEKMNTTSLKLSVNVFLQTMM
jgi:hypothetical protein